MQFQNTFAIDAISLQPAKKTSARHKRLENKNNNDPEQTYRNQRREKQHQETNRKCPILHAYKTKTRKAKYKKTKNKLIYNQTRTTTISHKNGLNKLNIASPNPDHFTTNEMQNDIIQQLAQTRIHTASIQETHIPQKHLLKNKKNAITP